jgi:precorrin-2 dehydrogenase/sirohydrochlorin ferrochelatase
MIALQGRKGRHCRKEAPVKYYPIYLNIANKRCVVVGGGEVAERKTQRLLKCGARVVVVGKALTPFLEQKKNEGAIEQIAADYEASCLEGAFLVIGATDLDEVNGRISADAGARGMLVNIADDPARCDFILPAVFQQGDLAIAVSTGGKSPALAKRLRQEFEGRYGPEYAVLLNILGDLRKRVVAGGRSSAENKLLFENIVNTDVLGAIREENWGRVREIVRGITGLEIDAAHFPAGGATGAGQEGE